MIFFSYLSAWPSYLAGLLSLGLIRVVWGREGVWYIITAWMRVCREKSEDSGEGYDRCKDVITTGGKNVALNVIDMVIGLKPSV